MPGAKADSLYIVSSGKIRIYRLSESGKEQLLRIVIPGEFTGELALFKEGIYEAFAEALEDTYICTISHCDFKNLIFTYPNRLSHSEEQTAWISTETVRERIIHYLTRIYYYEKDSLYVKLEIPKKDLASYLGNTPESLSRDFTNLENLGTINYINKNTIKLNGFKFEISACKIIQAHIITLMV